MAVIVFDFDGVLCEYKGWRGHDKIGKPIELMVELVSNLFREGHTLKLCTTRLNPYPRGNMWEDEVVSSGKAREIIMDWLKENNILRYFKEITGYKPFGDVYIDDRALRFDGYEWMLDEDKKWLVELDDDLKNIYEHFKEDRKDDTN